MYRVSNCQHPPINCEPRWILSFTPPVFHEQQRICGAFTEKDCAAVTGAICSSCSIADQLPHSVQSSSFSESCSKNRIMPDGSIIARWSCCNPVRSAKVSCSGSSFSVNISFTIFSRKHSPTWQTRAPQTRPTRPHGPGQAIVADHPSTAAQPDSRDQVP